MKSVRLPINAVSLERLLDFPRGVHIDGVTFDAVEKIMMLELTAADGDSFGEGVEDGDEIEAVYTRDEAIPGSRLLAFEPLR